MNDIIVWCDECGTAGEWKHPKKLSARRRRVMWLARMFWVVGRAFSHVGNALIAWADRPAREQYDAYLSIRHNPHH